MILVLNLKMNLSKDSIITYENSIRNKKVIVLPQYPYLAFFQGGEYSLGSQDVSKYSKGSYTGEVCAKGLKDLGVKYCLIGHSERKEMFHENVTDFKMKIQNAIDNELIPIYCVNETEDDYFNDIELKNIEEQLEAIPPFTRYIIVAFEPTWLIGKSTINIDTERINKVLICIKNYLMERNINHSIIYGGGINKDNIDILKNLSCNDGFIISSSALDLNELESIYTAIQ
jgi:triosephosphate isomerase